VPTPFASKREARDFFSNSFSMSKDNAQNRIIGMFLHTNIIEREKGRFDWRFSERAVKAVLEELSHREFWPEMKRLSRPALFLRGEKSDHFSVEDYRKISRDYPAIVLHEVKGSGHWVHSEASAEFISTILSFL